MSRRTIKRNVGIVGATLTTGALLLASPGLAHAATYDNGSSQSNRSVTDGSGNADARARATDAGRLTITTEARGGNTAGPLGGQTSQPTEATGSAYVTKRVSAAKGTYRVVISYQGLKGVEKDRGADSSAEVTRTSIVKFVSQTGGGDRKIRRVQELPTQSTTKKTVVLISVPNGSSGSLRLAARLDAHAQADGRGSVGVADAKVNDVDFTVTRVR